MTDPPGPVGFHPIGWIRTPFTDIEGMPIQGSAAVGIEGSIELRPDLEAGLTDVGGFSHLVLLYHLDRASAPRLSVTPFLDDHPRGIFATRSPARPNPIGLSTVRLLGIEGATLRIADVDMLDRTPLLDIKPYVPAFDDRAEPRIGWYAHRLGRLPATRSDHRFGPDRHV
jgi:tRNA-Thr(GGU) m(6)t(6)A37 methyltransferase TsaA